MLIRGKLFWIFTALALAVAVHTAYLLAAPGLTFSRAMARSGKMIGAGEFRLIGEPEQARLFPTFPSANIFGICGFDVTDKDTQISAAMPAGFWTLTIYSRSGKVVYSLNSQQAGTSTFTVTLTKAPSLIETLLKAAPDDTANFDGWKVATSEPSGIAVFWVPVSETAGRTAVERVIGGTRCREKVEG